VRLGAATKRVTGKLGGRRFDLSLAKVKLARVQGGEWPTQPARLSPLDGAEAGGRLLGRLSPRLP